ncbi:MAG: efflux RND transporter permease subunit, partial [Verrucomicrobiae bacterium]|nr:efflux RND transporter permease subunit [Verrucomicrobiae bacterium]
EEVESFISVPLENALNGLAWLKTLRSKSVLGLSSVVCIFEPGTDLMQARQLVQERVATVAPRLPSLARAPVLLPPLSSTSRAMKIGVSSKTLSQMDLSELAVWTIRPRLMAVPGVANVAIWGQRDRQLQILVDPERLAAVGVALDAIIRAAGDAVVVSSSGFVDSPNQRFPVRQLSSIQTAEDLARSVLLFTNGAAIRIGDVARVVVNHPPPIGDAVINDGPGLLLIVEKQPWGNTLEVTRKVEAALEALKPGLKEVEMDSTIFRPATFIERSLHNLTEALLLGCILVVVILTTFLFEWRAALISLSAIPLSLLGPGLVLHFLGATWNTMVLAGLVIAVGEVVDDAIIDVENVSRRLRLNREAGSPESSFRVVLKASLEVRSAVVFASLIVVLVFLPVFFLDGLAGTFFRPLALAYILAILASLFVALTVTPALCLFLLPGQVRSGDSPLVRPLKAAYRRCLPPLLRRPRWAAGTVIIALGATVFSLRFLGENFLPDFKETDFLMHWVEKPGTSLEAMRRITIRVSQELRSIPGVRNFGAHIGRAEVADEVVGPNFTELWISLDPKVDYDSTVARVRETIEGYPGLFRDVLTYLKERIKEVLTGASAAVVVRIYGPDLEVLRSKAAEIRHALQAVEGVVDLKIEPQVLVPHIQINLRPEAAAAFGLTPGQARRAITTLIQGQKVGEVYRDQKVFDVTVWGEPHVRTDVQALRALLIETSSGTRIPLGDIAELEVAPTANEIKREAASRRLDITCNVASSDLGGTAREIESRVRGIGFDRGYHPEFLGEYAARQAARDRMRWLSLLSVAGILVLLWVDFQSIRLTLLAAFTLPLALIGGVIGAFLGGGVLSIGSLVGFVTVLGIAARNGIMLLSHFRHLEENEAEPFGVRLLVRGAEERLAPILMTAGCAGLALLPLIIRGNVPGHEIEYPMAVVILGGIVSSTMLNLFVVPVLYGAYGRPKRTSTRPLDA